ncbi:inosine/uridine-preferring nucleoside hydrolase [Flammeovirgaceae bacterium 311]|nr:inosine/uridine-preferring nucleoside hydrolase [Flammeovirgaceae bacterium 311]
MVYNVGCRRAEVGKDTDAVKIIFDTDMGSDCDDVGALSLLHSYADRGMAEILGCVYSSGKVPYGAGIVEAINIYHGRPDIPVGAVHDTIVGDPVDKMSAEKLAKDTAAFQNRIVHNLDAVEQTKLNRQLLFGQEDKSVVYVTVGHPKGLYDLLVSGPDDISNLNGYELIEKKVKRWVALGALGANNNQQQYRKDWNFFFNKTAPFTKYLVDNFPGEIHFVDAGNDVMTGKSLINTHAGNIVRTAYRDWLWNVEKKSLEDQRPSWDLATVYYAVEWEGAFLRNVGNGWLEFNIENGCRWHRESGKSNQFFVVQREGINNLFAHYLNGKIGIR